MHLSLIVKSNGTYSHISRLLNIAPWSVDDLLIVFLVPFNAVCFHKLTEIIKKGNRYRFPSRIRR